MNDKLIYHTTILFNNSQGGNAFWLSYLVELWLAKSQTLHLETAYFGQSSSSTGAEMCDFQTQTVDLKYPLDLNMCSLIGSRHTAHAFSPLPRIDLK